MTCCPVHQRLQPLVPEAATPCTQGCDPVHQVLELVPGRALTEADMLGAARARTPLLATVTRAIRTLHAAPLPPELSAFAQGATGWGGPHLVQWVAYARQQGYCRLPILEGIDELLAQADAAAGAPGPPSFCHFDLLPDNFVLRAGGAEVSLVDFEYAAAGQPLMDLAVLCMGCGLEGAEERNLLASYLEVDQPSEAQAHAFAALKLLACLRETLWGVTAEISGSSALRADEAVSYADLNYAKFVRARAALVLPARGVPPALVFTMPESTA
jgi:aminoglycoside phosphotransferase (APT) family kinase protein